MYTEESGAIYKLIYIWKTEILLLSRIANSYRVKINLV